MLNIHLPSHLAVLLFNIHPGKMKTYVHTKICSQMSIGAVFIIAPKLEIAKISMDGQRDFFLIIIYTKNEYYPTLTKNGLLILEISAKNKNVMCSNSISVVAWG